jgi:peptide/nickel transport system permease protein
MTPPHSGDGASATAKFRRDGAARIALGFVVLLLGHAIAAPLLASNRPYWLVVPEAAAGGGFGALEAGAGSPWLRSLFDPRLYPTIVDQTFNALLLLSPFLLLAAVRRVRLAPLLLVWVVAAVALAAALDDPQPARDYGKRVAALREEGHAVRALFPPVPFHAAQTDLEHPLESPSARHWLGTDDVGRDVFARTIFGARTSLAVATLAALLATAIGIAIGAAAGFLRGGVDLVLSRLIEVAACMPFLVILLTLVALLGRHEWWHVVMIVGLVGWDGTARLVRGEILRLRESDFALSAIALGLPWPRILLRHLLPFALTPVVVTLGFSLAGWILVESTLAFLNLSDSTLPSWGQILRAGRDSGKAHLILVPGLLIFAVVTALNLIADAARSASDPRSTS